MSALCVLAPAKVNLGLWLGQLRPSDARHRIVSVMQAISLADEVVLEPAGADAEQDEIECAGVAGEPQQNLALAALRAFRAGASWRAAPQRLRIRKRIPVAAGLGGGSSDAAAVLRLAANASGLGDERLLVELASSLGADVPALIRPGRWLAGGAGERLKRLPEPAEALHVLVLALPAQLSTGAVYRRADELGLARPDGELDDASRKLSAALAEGAALPAPASLLHNDLARAASSLCPQIEHTLAQARAAGASCAVVSGSGPTVVGLFAGPGGRKAAQHAAARLRGRVPAPVLAHAVAEGFAAPRPAAGQR